MKLKAYIVEDETYQCLMLEDTLIQKSIQVLGFSKSGEGAFEDILQLKEENQLPHLLFLDMNLQNAGLEWSGVDLLQSLWKNNIKIPFVVISQYSDYKERLRPFIEYEVTFIAKNSDLSDSIDYALNKYSLKFGYTEVSQFDKWGNKEIMKVYYEDIICVCSLKYAAENFGEINKKDGNNIIIYVIENESRCKPLLVGKDLKAFSENINYVGLVRLNKGFILNKKYKSKDIITPKPYVKMKCFDTHEFNIGGEYKEEYRIWRI